MSADVLFTSYVLLLQLFPPKDDKLDDFWIDFNIHSGCVSFFIDEPEVQLQWHQRVNMQLLHTSEEHSSCHYASPART